MADEFEIRVDELSGAEIVVVGDRQHRPSSTSDSPEGCPFCVGGLEAPERYDTRWFPNRWPPIPGGRAEVLLYSPDHHASLASIGVAGVEGVIDLWRTRTAALAARPDVAYVLVFENRGRSVGATIAHPHGQVYGYPFVPPVPMRELRSASCALCTPPPDELVVSRVGGWAAWVPAAAVWPFELRVAPAAHVPDLGSVADSATELAAVLTDVLGRLDAVFDEPMPYMMWWHQAPCDGQPWPSAHVHLHVAATHRAPHTTRYVAGAELGGGVYFNPIDPRRAAARLRAATSR